MELIPLHPLFAIEVRDFHLCRDHHDSELENIKEAFRRYSVLVFRDQKIDDSCQIRFSERLGPLETTKLGTDGAGTKLVRLTNMDSGGRILRQSSRALLNNKANQIWHSDSSFKRIPARASVLRAVVIPPERGETEYVSQRAVYQSLSLDLKQKIGRMWGIHDYSHSRIWIDSELVTEDEKRVLPPVRQPMVINHGPYGKSLYIGAHLSKIEGMGQEEGSGLIQQLMKLPDKKKFIYRHRWKVHDVVLWDNLSVMHRATPFENQNSGRTMVRTTISCKEKLNLNPVFGSHEDL